MSLSQALDLAGRPLPPLSRLLVTIAVTVATWELRHKTRKSLGQLSPHLLADVGLDQTEARLETIKRFWHA